MSKFIPPPGTGRRKTRPAPHSTETPGWPAPTGMRDVASGMVECVVVEVGIWALAAVVALVLGAIYWLGWIVGAAIFVLLVVLVFARTRRIRPR